MIDQPLLAAADLPFYLIERGLLEREAIVDGDLVVADASRRNRNLKVLRRRGPSLFVKQPASPDPQAAATLRREATCFELAARHPGWAALRELVPEYFGYDDRRRLLVLGLIEGGRSAAEGAGWYGPAAAVAGAAGRALGRFHRAAGELAAAAPEGAFPGSPPWILLAHRTEPSWMPATAPGQLQLLGWLRVEPRVHRAFESLLAGWRTEALIHGDLKWDNLVLTGAADAPEARIVDWELADLGDPAWDLGALLQTFVAYPVLSMPPAAGPAGAPAELHPAVWAAVQPAATALWRGYVEGRGLASEAAAELLGRALRLAGGRAVLGAYEHLHQAPALTPQAVALTVAGLDLTEHPAEWGGRLFGGGA